jgi:hypothetical protein
MEYGIAIEEEEGFAFCFCFLLFCLRMTSLFMTVCTSMMGYGIGYLSFCSMEFGIKYLKENQFSPTTTILFFLFFSFIV